jgi:hypothetical protein
MAQNINPLVSASTTFTKTDEETHSHSQDNHAVTKRQVYCGCDSTPMKDGPHLEMFRRITRFEKHFK